MMTAQSLLMAERTKSVTVGAFPVSYLPSTGIPFKTGHMSVGNRGYELKLYEHIPVDPETGKPGQFDPEREWTDIHIKTPDGRVYWGNVETIGYLRAQFDGSHQPPQIYSDQTLMSIVKRADILAVANHFKLLIRELGLEELCKQKKLRLLGEEEEGEARSGKTYKQYRAAYHARYADAQLSVDFPDDFDPYNGRVTVHLTTDEGMFASQFVSFGYLDRILKRLQETKRMIINPTSGEIDTPHGIHIPFCVVLGVINRDTISETIDSLVDKFRIEDHFTQ